MLLLGPQGSGKSLVCGTVGVHVEPNLGQDHFVFSITFGRTMCCGLHEWSHRGAHVFVSVKHFGQKRCEVLLHRMSITQLPSNLPPLSSMRHCGHGVDVTGCKLGIARIFFS